jgi:hypothetical protein
MQSIFGKGSLYGVRATLRPDPDIMLGTSVDALAWLAKMGGPLSQRDSSSHEEEFKRCLRLAGAHFQWRRANDPCWKPRGGT